MTVLLVVAGIVLGMFTYEPMWFDTRPHYYAKTYENIEQCQAEKKVLEEELLFPEVNKKGAVCTDHNALYLTQ
jgi:hypothetical protein